MGNQQDIPTESRTDFVASVQTIKRQIERKTDGELHQHERNVRVALDACEQHRARAYRHDVTALLHELDFEPEDYRGFPSLDFATDEDMARAVAEIAYQVVRTMPRKACAILDVMHFEGRVVYWGLSAEPVDDLPYEAA